MAERDHFFVTGPTFISFSGGCPDDDKEEN